MDDDVHSVHGARETAQIAHVPDEIAQIGLFKSRLAHFMLLEFVPAEYDHLGGLVLIEQNTYEFPAKRSGPACYQYDLLFPVHAVSTT